jgi:hypothetical protein
LTAPPGSAPASKPQTAAEAEAEALLTWLGVNVEHRAFPVQLPGQHTYTADMLACGRDGLPILVEVKGYRHFSVGRSRLAFDAALVARGYDGIWIEKRKATRGKAAHWRIEVFAACPPATPSPAPLPHPEKNMR